MTLRANIASTLDKIYTSANLGDTLTYIPDDGTASVELTGSWATGDTRAAPAAMQNNRIGEVVFTFPKSQLAAVLPGATFQHPSYENPWHLVKPAYALDDFTWVLELTQKQKGRQLGI